MKVKILAWNIMRWIKIYSNMELKAKTSVTLSLWWSIVLQNLDLYHNCIRAKIFCKRVLTYRLTLEQGVPGLKYYTHCANNSLNLWTCNGWIRCGFVCLHIRVSGLENRQIAVASAPPVTYSFASAPTVTKSVASAPTVTYSVASAPTVTYSVAPAPTVTARLVRRNSDYRDSARI